MRVRYQRGYLRLGQRKKGPDRWEFLWWDSESTGERVRPQPRQRLGIRYFLVPSAGERAIDQIRPYFSLQRVVAPVPHMLQDQQPERHFCRCLRSSTRPAIRMTLSLRIVYTFRVFQKLIYLLQNAVYTLPALAPGEEIQLDAITPRQIRTQDQTVQT